MWNPNVKRRRGESHSLRLQPFVPIPESFDETQFIPCEEPIQQNRKKRDEIGLERRENKESSCSSSGHDFPRDDNFFSLILPFTTTIVCHHHTDCSIRRRSATRRVWKMFAPLWTLGRQTGSSLAGDFPSFVLPYLVAEHRVLFLSV